jgi:signal transduction histidine kinase
MSGVDGIWQDAGNRRQAFYTNVSPGLHQFRVIAANEDGVWNTTGATFGIILAPAFYQTQWFYALCILASLALLWQLYRLRLHQLRLRLDERVKERERIARELHDTLLQGAQGMILIFQGFAGQLDKHSPMRERMEIALDQADHLLNEARGRVSELRGIGVDGDLAQALRRSAQEIFNGSDLRFNVTSTGSPIPLIRSSADEICLITREAMSNARRHARATLVEIDIVFDIRELRILVRDDGAGIDPALLEAARSDHYGLQGMKERAERLGAQLHFGGRPGAGTEVELIAPARSVYCNTHGALLRRLLSSWRRSRPLGAHRSNDP